MISTILEFLKNPEFWAVVAALVVSLRAIGEVFKKIGDMIPGEDWTDGVVAWISKICIWIGKIMAWLQNLGKMRLTERLLFDTVSVDQLDLQPWQRRAHGSAKLMNDRFYLLYSIAYQLGRCVGIDTV